MCIINQISVTSFWVKYGISFVSVILISFNKSYETQHIITKKRKRR